MKKNYTKSLHELGEYIRSNISEIEEHGLSLIDGKLSIIREIITQDEKRTGRDDILFLHQYHLTNEVKEAYMAIAPLTQREKNILTACTLVAAAFELDGTVPYPVTFITQLCTFIADEVALVELPDYDE